MKKQQKKDQPSTKNHKHKEAEKQKEKSDQETDADLYYTKEEMALLDKYHDYTQHLFEDEEIYDVMLKYHNDEDLIINELNEMVKETKRGDEYKWQKIGESKFFFI